MRHAIACAEFFVITGDLVMGARNAEVGYPKVKQLVDEMAAEFRVPILQGPSAWPGDEGHEKSLSVIFLACDSIAAQDPLSRKNAPDNPTVHPPESVEV